MRGLILGAILAGMATGAAAQDGPPPGPAGAPNTFGSGAPGRGPHGRLFISPMGEPFRGSPDAPAPQDQWFDGADADHDGALTPAEMVADAGRFFATLDMRKDVEIDPDDIERYETVVAPEIRVGGFGGGMRMAAGGRGGGRGRGPRGGGQGGHGGGGFGEHAGGAKPGGAQRDVRMKQGAARFGYLDYPEPISVADRNFNRGVDPQEFAKAAEARFDLLDSNGDGRIEKSELPKLQQGSFGGSGSGGRRRGKRGDGREAMPQD